jgi:hypothetical protein
MHAAECSVASGRSCRHALPVGFSLECILAPFRHVNQTVSTLCNPVCPSLKGTVDWSEQARNTCGYYHLQRNFGSGDRHSLRYLDMYVLAGTPRNDNKQARVIAVYCYSAPGLYVRRPDQ